MSDRLRIALAVVALAGGVLVSMWQAQNPFRGVATFDFIARYAAGETVADGESPYDKEAHYRHAVVHGDPIVVPVFDAPPVIAAFRVLTVLPMRAAATALTAMSYLSVGVLAWYVTRRARAPSDAGTVPPSGQHQLAMWTLCALALLQTSPVRHVLALGQIDLVAMALVLLFAAWVPAFALLKPQTVALTAAAIFGRAIGVEWPLSLRTIRWKTVVIALVTAAALLAFSYVFAEAAHWDDWLRRVRDRQEGSDLHWLVPVFAAAGVVVTVRGIHRAHRAGRRIDMVCVAAGFTSMLAVSGDWNPQWFLAVLIPLAAVVVPYLLGQLTFDRVSGVVLIGACSLVAGDGFASLSENDPHYHWQVPMVALGGVLFAFWVLRLLPALPAVAILALNTAIVVYPLTDVERIAVPVLAAVGVLYVLLEVRPSGLLEPLEPEDLTPAEVAEPTSA